jgi:hypothetical protein
MQESKFDTAEVDEIEKQDDIEDADDGVKWPPYRGKDTLERARKTKSGRFKPGKVRYLINRNGNIFKLIAVWRNPGGMKRSMVRPLHPMKQNDRGKEDRALLRELQKCGVQGAEF